MVVKAVRGRRRYIAFTLSDTFVRETLISKLRAYLQNDAPYVVQCSQGWAIVRCEPKDIDRTIALMSQIDPSSKSLCTSGTLITLRKRYPVLQQLRPPARR